MPPNAHPQASEPVAKPSERDDLEEVVLEDIDEQQLPAEAAKRAEAKATREREKPRVQVQPPALAGEDEPGGTTRHARKATTRFVVRPDPDLLVRIADGGSLEIDAEDPWQMRQIDRELQKGRSPMDTRREVGDVLVLGRRNGLLFWFLILQTVAVLVLLGLIANRLVKMPARVIPTVAQVEVYKKVQKEQVEIEHFAEMVCARMETWDYWKLKAVPGRVIPFLDPGARGEYEARFNEIATEAERFKERHFFAPVNTQYVGVSQDTFHRLFVFYQVVEGAGEQDAEFKVTRQARRIKILNIGEGQISDENRYGLYVISHFDFTERMYMEVIRKKDPKAPNPWDAALGTQEKKESKKADSSKADKK